MRKYLAFVWPILLVCVIATGIASYLVYRDSRAIVISLLQRQLLLVVEEVAEEVHRAMDNSQEIVDIVASLPGVTLTFRQDLPVEEKRNRLKDVQTTIRVMAEKHAATESILLFDTDGDVVVSTEGVRGSVAHQPFFSAVMGNVTSTGITDDPVSGEERPYLAAPIHDTGLLGSPGKVIGGIVVYLDNKKMFLRWINRVKEDPLVRLLVLGPENTPLFYIWGDPPTQPIKQGIALEDSFKQLFLSPPQSLIFYTAEGPRVAMYSQVPGMDWNVLLVNDEAYFLHGPTELLYRSAEFAFIIALLVLGAVTLLIRSLIGRLERANDDVTRITNTIPGAVIKIRATLDGKYEIVSANSAFYELIGYTEQEVQEELHNDLSNVVFPEDTATMRAIIEESVQLRTHPTVEMRAKRKDGSIYWTSTRASYVVEPSGNILLDAVLLDVTDIKEAQNTLREQKYILEKLVEERTASLAESEASSRQEKALLRSVLHHIPDFIYYKDLDGKYLGCNASCSVLFGVPPEEIPGKTDFELLAGLPGLAEQCVQNDEMLRATGEPQRDMQEQAILPDGRHLNLETTKALFLDEEGTPLGLVGISRDVTERENITRELQKSKEEAQSANKAKSEFLANMSHEIRTPLNGIIGMNHLALQSDPPPRIEDYLLKMESSAQNLLGIINEILDFSKIEAGKIDLDNHPFALQSVLASLSDMFTPMAAKKGITLSMPCMETGNIFLPLMGDDLRLGQVFMNLLSNAIKFTDKGMVEVDAKTTAMPDGRVLLTASVADTGIGLSQENISRLFASFAQADSSITRRFGGTGLGLTISKSLIELMGGSIRVESEVGVGSTFIFTAFFDTPPEGSSLCLPPPGPPCEEAPVWFENLHVLLVEDNEINQLIAQEMLSMKGCVVDVANNGVEAVAHVENTAYALILMDIQMPYMDGFEATRRIRSTNPHVPIIAMTAHALQEDRKKSLAAGMQEHISKPIDPDKLYQVMKAVLDSAKKA